MKVEGKKVVIIPDVHHDIDWVESILGKETDHDFVIWLGDWFDTNKKGLYGARATAEWLVNRMDNNPDDIFLIGNHDMSYNESSYRLNPHGEHRCSGWTRNKAQKIKDIVTRSHWKRFEPFIILNNSWLLSHAGFSRKLLSCYDDIDANLKRLYAKAKDVIEFPMMKNEMFNVGPVRGGFDAFSGITWLDFKYEFQNVPEVPYKQIVGHTTTYKMVLSHKFNFDIDATQTAYALIENNEIIIKSPGDITEIKIYEI